MQMVGALNTAPGKPLPADLQQFLDGELSSKPRQSTNESQVAKVAGAIYVSMGTAVQMEAAEVMAMAANLAALDRPVLWKISNSELPGNASDFTDSVFPRPAAHQSRERY